MDVQKIIDIESIIDSIDTKSLNQLIGFRNRVTEAFNVVIKDKRELNKKKRERNKKIVRPRLFISESSNDSEFEANT
tara:strand:+ start:356 stop:586 length:231 start_codon:yes stop_codon:yes gene_type:complete